MASTPLTSGEGPNPGQGNWRPPTWAWMAGATAIQALSAFVQLGEPLRTIVFFLILLTTTMAVIGASRHPPTWFIAGILVAVAIFVVSSPNGRSLLAALSGQTGSREATAPTDDGLQESSFPSIKYVSISVFLESDSSGKLLADKPPVTGVEVEVGEPQGMKKAIPDLSGTTGPQQVLTRGAVIVTVCGVSQAHEVSNAHSSKLHPLIILVGLSERVREFCTPASEQVSH